ncbi:MAG: xanthine dehydrogenase family protein molybdopterin-binding subunit, partial [bacterium]
MTEPMYAVGKPVARIGLADKIVGKAKYTADLKRPGMLYARVLRSPHPHARIVEIDPSGAAAMPGVHAVLTHLDVPAQRLDADLLALDPHLRYVGDEVALVAAESEDQAEDALERIEVAYEVLPAVFDAEAALAPGAPELHPGGGDSGNLVDGKPLLLQRGDTEAGMAAAHRVFEGTFVTQFHAPGGMETRAALAEWEGERLTMWKTSRALHARDRAGLAQVLGMEPEKIRVICPNMGGGFGNKDESRMAVLVALLARKAGRPVRLEYSRDEEIIAGHNRQATVNRLRIGIAEDGAPIAIELDSVLNGGAYVASGRNVTRRIGQAALYLYTCPNARFEGRSVYTNRPAGGSFRGLGAPLGHFAVEVTVDRIAEALGVDPLDYRLRHHVTAAGQPGRRTTPPGRILPDEPVEGGLPFSSNGLRDCLLAGAERIGWREKRQPNGSASGPVRRGMGVAMGLYKGGIGREAEAEVRITPRGRVDVRIGGVDVGQGSATVMAQFAAEVLQVPMEAIDVTMADTDATPPSHITAGSSTTVSSGAAVKLAAEEVRSRLLEHAAVALGVRQAVLRAGVLSDAAGGGGNGKTIEFAALAAGLERELVGKARLVPGSTEFLINSFAAHFAEVEVDLRSGRIRLLRYVAAQDSGRIV